MSASALLATELPGAAGGLVAAAAVAVSLAGDAPGEGALMIELGAERGRGPTMLASAAARRLEERLRDADLPASARGRLAWLGLPLDEVWLDGVGRALEAAGPVGSVIVYLPPREWEALLARGGLEVGGAVLRADLPAQRALAALAAIQLRAVGIPLRVVTVAPGRVAARRVLAGIDPGGEAGRCAARAASSLARRRSAAAQPPRARRRLAAEAGQALPLAIGGVLALIACALVLAAFGGAVSGKSRAQRAADLAALSAARSMRDDYDRLYVAAERPDGTPNPAHLDRGEYLDRASAAAREAGDRNGIVAQRLRIEFPDAGSFAPLRVRAEVSASLRLGGREFPVATHAVAQAVPPAARQGHSGVPATASGGGYSGPLVYRQGEPMRPDVAGAFDRLQGAATAAGVTLVVNSAYRSDAEQAALFAANPDPRWVARPGTSLHRCATELDLGPPAAYSWLAANAGRFGFVQRYGWEPWHFGYDRGPAPCSAAGDQPAADDRPASQATGAAESGAGLPSYVPQRFREAIARAASRWNVAADLLAAQLMAESNFNPFAVSPAGAQGIAQFMPPTAAAYGLHDPFDAEAAIDAQAQLMADLLERLGSVELALAAYNAGPGPVEACGCVPAIPETQAYVAHIIGLMHGGGAPLAPMLEVRLVG